MEEQLSMLTELVNEIEGIEGPFFESRFAEKVRELIQKTTANGGEPMPELLAEAMAFSFIPNHQNSDWGTYFGPKFVLTNEMEKQGGGIVYGHTVVK